MEYGSQQKGEKREHVLQFIFLYSFSLPLLSTDSSSKYGI